MGSPSRTNMAKDLNIADKALCSSRMMLKLRCDMIKLLRIGFDHAQSERSGV